MISSTSGHAPRVNYKVWMTWADVLNDCEVQKPKSFVRKWETEDSITFVVNAQERTGKSCSPQYEVYCSFVPYSVANNIAESFPWLKLKKHKHLFFVEGVIKDIKSLLELYQHTSPVSSPLTTQSSMENAPHSPTISI